MGDDPYRFWPLTTQPVDNRVWDPAGCSGWNRCSDGKCLDKSK